MTPSPENVNQRRTMLYQRLVYYRKRLDVFDTAVGAYVEICGDSNEVAREHLKAIRRNVLNEVAAVENELKLSTNDRSIKNGN